MIDKFVIKKNREYKPYLGDNRDVFKKLPNDSIDLIITDPPYKDYQSNRPTYRPKVKKINESEFDLPYFICESARVLKPGGHFYCWCDHQTFPLIVNEITRLQDAMMSEGGLDYLKYKNCLIWVKNNHGSGDLNGNFAPQHEFIIYASKGKSTNPLNGKRPSNVLFKCEDKNIKFFAKVRNSKYKHGTSKPVEILNILVEASSLEGDLVFDPYAGSMSTGEACVLLGRKHLLAEIDPEFYDIGLERLKKITKLK